MEIQLAFGVLSDPIEEQLEKQGLKFKNDKTKESIEKAIFAWQMLRMKGFLPDSEADKIAKRIMKEVEKSVMRID